MADSEFRCGMRLAPTLSEELPVPSLPVAVPRAGVSEIAREALRQWLGDTDRELAAKFHAGIAVEKLIHSRARAVELLIASVWRAWIGESALVALFAVGGFGRGELFPHSDVDLLVLSKEQTPPTALRAIEAFFACLWDIGLKPGNAVRTTQQCLEVARADATVMTSLMEARFIAGASDLESDLCQVLALPDLWPPQVYFETKRAEQELRHARFNATAYNLEPNLKEGPGGLRSMQLMAWLGQRISGAKVLADLVGASVLARQELAALQAAQTGLWRIRFALHLLAKRAEDRLLFDYQRDLARQLGFTNLHARNLDVEQFMQDYFRTAITIERLNERVLQRFEEHLNPADPVVQRLNLDFLNVGGYLDAENPNLLQHRPVAWIDLFRVWSESPQLRGLSANLTRQIQNALEQGTDTWTTDADVSAAFLRLLRRGGRAVEALLRMNHSGVLARYLPAFGQIVGRMQYDLFHVYTVDEHAMRVLRMLAHFATLEGRDEFPLAHQIQTRITKPEVLLLAALFHDIAKGRGGDHSELGEVEARAFCARLHMSEADTELVAWLVRWHLLMSATAQRQDITDPSVVHNFALQIAEWERLDLLYLLTVADINGTNPKLWNSWKDKLLSDLYIAARYMLRRDLEQPPHVAQRVAECQQQVLALLRADGIDQACAHLVWTDFPEESFLRYQPQQIAWQTKAIAATTPQALPLVLVNPSGTRGCTEIFIYSPDRDGLFATVAITLDRFRLSVQEARVMNSKAGISLNTFLVLDSHARSLEVVAAQNVALALQRALIEVSPPRLAQRAVPRNLRYFKINTKMEFIQNAENNRTQLALISSDKPGLLARVAQTFRDCQVRVHEARIATFGERVEDFFQITDETNSPLDQFRVDQLRNALLNRLEAQIQDTPRAGGKTKDSHAQT